jgi:AAA domain/TrwC relaxase
MHGGVKVYRGAPSAARNYLEADRSRADDYYLAEGTGIARRFTAGPNAPVVELASLAGDGYEGWVAGLDPGTGEPRGRVRTDGHAVRFVEVTINGPKSWSLAAELHPDVAAAYEAAQDRAAAQVIGWLAEHATTRVGPRGAQFAVPVDRLEAVTVHARVFAVGKWRGLDTVAVRDSINAINGIGHAAVVCDPDFRAALAGHGYALNPDGEIEQLARFVGPFSRRAEQIATNIDRYEADWRREHPNQVPGPGQWRAWDARAWAEDRPDKIVPRSGAELRQRWLTELAELGYRDRDKPVQLTLPLTGQLNRDVAVAEVLTRLGAARSAWNAADVHGEVEQLLARAGVVTDPAVRGELAEDLTARAVGLCVPLREQPTPEHVRALSSRHVLDVEADLLARLAARGAAGVATVEPTVVNGLDAGQRAAVTALAGDARLVVVEGAAGAGKTTTLAAAREALAARGHRLLVVTPTLKAAQAATAEVGTRAGSAAWLAWQHGWRWDATGAWTRTPTDPLPEARLRTGDLLLVDEAGMLDQDTARALVTIADETGARVALVGDRHQLPAVGRGGVLDLAHRQVHPVTAFSRDRADLGPAAAGRAAERAAGGYIPAGQPPDPDTLADVLHELRDAWSARLTAHWQLQRLQERLARVQAQAAWEALCQQTLAPLETLCDAVRVAAQQAEQAATGCATVLAERAEQHTARLRRTWDAQLLGADQAARTIAAGPGRLGMHRGPGPRRQATPRRLGRHLVPDGRRRRPRPAAASSPPGRLPVHRAAGRLRAPPARPAVGRRRTPRPGHPARCRPAGPRPVRRGRGQLPRGPPPTRTALPPTRLRHRCRRADPRPHRQTRGRRAPRRRR